MKNRNNRNIVPVVVYLLVQCNQQQKLQSDKIAVNHRAAQKDAEVSAWTSGRCNFWETVWETKLLSRCTNQLSVRSCPSDTAPPSPWTPYCHKAVTDLFVLLFFLLLFSSQDHVKRREASWTFVWDGEIFLSIKSQLATGGTRLTDRGAWQNLGVHSEFYEKPIKKQTAVKI